MFFPELMDRLAFGNVLTSSFSIERPTWAFLACYGTPLSETDLYKLDPETVRDGLKELTNKESLSMNDLMSTFGLFSVIPEGMLSPEALELGSELFPLPHNFEYFPAPKEKKPRTRDKGATRRRKRLNRGYQAKKALKRASR